MGELVHPVKPQPSIVVSPGILPDLGHGRQVPSWFIVIVENKMQSQSMIQEDAGSVDWALLCVRIAAGIIFVAHGAQKLFGAFGGPGLGPIVQMMGPIGYLVSIGEFFGGLGLIFGFLSRFSAASLIVIMLGAIVLVHAKNGFFLSPKMGFEFNFALIGLLAPVLLAGPGRIAIGRLLPLPKKGSSGRPIPVLE